MPHSLTLRELNLLVRKAVETALPSTYWVEAELSEARESNGHCYMELIEKDAFSNAIVARASAKCWRNVWQLVRLHFERVTGERLHSGMKVLLQVYAQFHEAYGFSWIVADIDPTFTLGDMARKRQEVIRQLKEEGVFDLNKELTLPLFAQRIAVITSLTAAGYGDFCDQLAVNAYGFSFQPVLFQAIMQGERTEESIINALNLIYDERNNFDCVVIIRGGGAVSDLSCFDSLALAENVANFPLPVITGIGHERDESVLDMVAHTRVKTPTAAAVLLIDNLKCVSDRIAAAQERIATAVNQRMEAERMRLNHISANIPVLFSLIKTRQETVINALSTRLDTAVRRQVERNIHRLQLLSQRIEALDPTLLLRRGYSITLHNGHAVLSTEELKEGDEIETRLNEGTIKSVITNKQKHISPCQKR